MAEGGSARPLERHREMLSVHIRPAIEGDLPRLVLLATQSMGSEGWTEDGYRTELALNPSAIQVLEYAGDVVGFLVARWDGVTLELLQIAVLPTHRRLGLATRLMDWLMAEAARLQTDVLLEVRAGNQGAKQLYTRHGFQVIGLRPGMYDHPKEDGYVMTKPSEIP